MATATCSCGEVFHYSDEQSGGRLRCRCGRLVDLPAVAVAQRPAAGPAIFSGAPKRVAPRDVNQMSEDVLGVSRELLIMIGGVVTSIATAGLNAVIVRYSDFNFLSLSFWLIVPVGALIGGVAAASGYYVTALWTHTMPSRRFLLEMVGIGISTWILGQWLAYATLRFEDGTPVSRYASFWEYFRFHAEHMKLRLGFRGNMNLATTGELGVLGYVREALQLAGFIVGGLAVWAFLSGKEVCDGCRKYAKVRMLLTAESPQRFQEVTAAAGLDCADARYQLAGYSLLGLDLALLECPSCRRQWSRPAAVVSRGQEPAVRLPLRAYSLSMEQSAALVAASVSTTRP